MNNVDSTVAASSLSQSSDLQERLADVLDEYLTSIEAGLPMDVEELVARHPEFAEPLREHLNGLALLRDGVSGFRVAAAAVSPMSPISPEASPQLGCLGDYQLVREIGRGGMGIVYEARQISLERSVALKILPFASMLDPKQVARFHNEARAAAQLHHPNIVPIHGVGTERGVHFYAMQFIDGRSLKEVVDELRSSRSEVEVGAVIKGDRITTIANLGIQAAEALHAAHECGIIHRDVKPSNLLLDAQGKLWIADFGLARRQTGGGVSKSGDVIGTLHYMSPEQARGESAQVDQRTDIYSLGATLYELLTLRRAYDGSDSAAVLQRIELGDCKSPRTWNPSIPDDLENVVVKAMSSVRDERYTTAQQMADDLRRFVDGKPTQAQRPTVAKRFMKWCRRHRRAVVTACLSTSITLAAIALGVGLAVHQSVQTRRAVENFQVAKAAVHEVGLKAAALLAQTPGTEHVRRELLTDILVYHRRFLEQAVQSPDMQRDVALTFAEMAKLNAQLGRKETALGDYREAERLLRQLIDRKPAREHQESLAQCLNNMGELWREAGQTDHARTVFRRAIDLQTRLRVDYPNEINHVIDQARTWNNLGLVSADRGEFTEAARCYQTAVEILESSVGDLGGNSDAKQTQASVYNNLSQISGDESRSQAIEWSKKALAIQRELVKEFNQEPRFKSDLAITYNNIAALAARDNKTELAVKAYDEAIALQRELKELEPFKPRHRQDWAVTLSNRGLAQTKLGKLPDAEASFEQALGLQQSLVKEFPADLEFTSRLGGIYNNLAMVLQRENGAASEYEKAIRYLKYAQRSAPDVAQYRDHLSRTYFNYGRLLRQLHRPVDAAEIALQRRELWPADTRQLFAVAKELTWACRELENLDASRYRGYMDEIVNILEQARRLGGSPPADFESDAIIQTLRADSRIGALLTAGRG